MEVFDTSSVIDMYVCFRLSNFADLSSLYIEMLHNYV